MQQEERLTLTGEDLYWKDEECWLDAERPDSHKIDQVYYKLAEYEDTGLSPAEIEALKHRAEVAEEALGELTVFAQYAIRKCYTKQD